MNENTNTSIFCVNTNKKSTLFRECYALSDLGLLIGLFS